MEKTDRYSLLVDPVTCDTDREKYNYLEKNLMYIKVVKREFNVMGKKQ